MSLGFTIFVNEDVAFNLKFHNSVPEYFLC